MAASIQLTCPHCFTERAGFEHRGHYERPSDDDFRMVVTLSCGVCMLSVGVLMIPYQLQAWGVGQMTGDAIRIGLIWPEAAEHKAPAGIPDGVRRYYIQGLDNLARSNYDAAGIMFRKALETALKTIHPAGRGSLYQRVEGLPAETGVTAAMKRWAHMIRQMGADAAHEDDPFEQKEAESIKQFAEVFLTQAFTLPSLIPDKAKT